MDAKKCNQDTDRRCFREEKENTAGSCGLMTFKHLVIMNLTTKLELEPPNLNIVSSNLNQLWDYSCLSEPNPSDWPLTKQQPQIIPVAPHVIN